MRLNDTLSPDYLMSLAMRLELVIIKQLYRKHPFVRRVLPDIRLWQADTGCLKHVDKHSHAKIKMTPFSYNELTRALLSGVEQLAIHSRCHLDLPGVERCAIRTRSRLCSLLYDKRTDTVGQVFLEREGQGIPARVFLSGEISEASIRFFQLYVEMQLRQMDFHGRCV